MGGQIARHARDRARVRLQRELEQAIQLVEPGRPAHRPDHARIVVARTALAAGERDHRDLAFGHLVDLPSRAMRTGTAAAA
jgi:hypothetical protein